MSVSDPYIYFLIGRAEYDNAVAAGQLVRSSLAEEGFLHGAPQEQLPRLVTKYYATVADLLVLVVDPAKVTAEVKWESAAGSVYPHVYGPLNMDAVVRVEAYC